MKLSFYGSAQEVTGSNFLLEDGGIKILIDCGLFQHQAFHDSRNYDPFSYNAADIDFVIATHAHLDHIGRLPKIVKDGFKGKIYSTPATRDLASEMLLDSLHVLQKEAERRKTKVFYDENDVYNLIRHFETVDYHEKIKIGELEIVFRDAGHILGSAIAEIKKGDKKIVFTGDLGNPPTPLLRSTEYAEEANILIIDSTYGDKIHEDRNERKIKLERVIEENVENKGVLLIPAFSLERTQEILFELNDLIERKRVPSVPVFLDSPLAIKIVSIYKNYERYFNKEAKYVINSGDDIFNFPNLRFTLTTEKSKKINDFPPPKIIIAGSGMMQGGRMLHHAKRYLPYGNNSVLFIGFQSAGSLGRKIKDGEKLVRVFDEDIEVKAKVQVINGYSAHPDKNQILDFINKIGDSLQKVFCVHAEPKSSLYLVQHIRDHMGIEAFSPSYGESFEI